MKTYGILIVDSNYLMIVIGPININS